MPKYIRTGGNDTWKDVYEVIGEEELYWEIKDKSIPKCIALISKCNVTKASDKLEDLCDEYVIYYIHSYHLITINNGEISFKDSFDYGFKLKFALENNYKICGAIWTEGTESEPILKSVAKINSKGKLELL